MRMKVVRAGYAFVMLRHDASKRDKRCQSSQDLVAVLILNDGLPGSQKRNRLDEKFGSLDNFFYSCSHAVRKSRAKTFLGSAPITSINSINSTTSRRRSPFSYLAT